ALEDRECATARDVLDTAPLVLGHRQRPPRPGAPPPSLVETMDRYRDTLAPAPEESEQNAANYDRAPSPREGDGAGVDLDGNDRQAGRMHHVPPSSEPIVIALPEARRQRARGRTGGGGALGLRGRTAGWRAWDGRSRDIALIASSIAAITEGRTR